MERLVCIRALRCNFLRCSNLISSQFIYLEDFKITGIEMPPCYCAIFTVTCTILSVDFYLKPIFLQFR